MDILSSLNAVGAVLRGAQGVMRELKRPRPSEVAFAQLLQQQLAASNPATSAVDRQKMLQELERNTKQFLSLRDTNGDGQLTASESGMTAQQFRALDANGDGKITLDELKAPALAKLKP